MSTYAPVSAVGWLDLDAAASERVSTLLRTLDEPGTLDHLGLGSVRDAFAALLNPGTSTVQTRLRYFIFLPWIFRRLEQRHVPPADFARVLRDQEARLIDCLRHLGPNLGVIGYRTGRELKRMPSEVYWGGLGSWGIRRYEIALADYGQRAAAFGRFRPERDDDGSVTVDAVAMWAALPDAPPDFLDADITFELTRHEALVLVDHIRQRHPTSLLAATCGDPASAAQADFPWEIPPSLVNAPLAEVLRHARCFSELTTGPQHVYNVLLARRARADLGWDTDALEAGELDRLHAWASLVSDRHNELRDWVREVADLWRLLAPYSRVGESTRSFIEQIVGLCLINPGGLADAPAVQTSIRQRELRLKSKRARLTHRAALETWNQAPSGGQLDYRWWTTRSYLSDLAAALARGS